MRLLSAVRALLILVVISPTAVFAQSSQSVSSAPVPRLINISGVFRPANGQPAGTVETVTLSIYADQDGGAPLWQETQTIALDAQGRYSLLLGATQADGVPAAVFGSGDAKWLGTVFERASEVEGPRVRITSVPYALRASDADTLGGLPASAYLRTSGAAAGTGTKTDSADPTSGPTPKAVLVGTANFLSKYTSGTDLGNSAVFENNGSVGIGTTLPLDSLHLRFTNTNGAVTGLAVQNLGGTAASYSGMLFYDQNGALGQFQGFNNSTHEYRINNIGRVSQPSGAFNGSINFMLGGASKFIIAPNGNIGIGTATPASSFELSNAIPATGNAVLFSTTYSDAALGSVFVGRRARGTAATPTAVQSGDTLALFGGRGYGGASFGSGTTASVFMRAAENWTSVAQGTSMHFNTTALGAASPTLRMTLDPSGNLGIGTTAPSQAVEAVRGGAQGAAFLATSFGAEETNGGGAFVSRNARGTAAAPAAVHRGDALGYFAGNGYGTTGFGEDFGGGMAIIAAEDWTDAAQGALVAFITQPVGSNEGAASLAIMPDGKVGIGTFDDIPTIADKLQVFGDIRVGTAGTNGCINGFGGNAIAGTCSSDRRFKKDITPFSHVLDRVTALQPVHYSWRASEFPERHFGNRPAYGLIAQDVEQVLPELVVTNGDGFKAVDYSELPLLTIQAVKDLNAEVGNLKSANDALRQRITELETSAPDALKQRVADLERLVHDLLATSARR